MLPIHYIPFDKLTRKAVPKFDKILGLSHFGRDQIQKGLPTSRIGSLYHVIDTAKYKPLSLTPYAASEPSELLPFTISHPLT